jgi:Glycosyltransferase
MSIVLLNQFFWPDTIATGQLLADVARQLAKKQNVFVLCGKFASASSNDDETVLSDVVIMRTHNFGFSHGTISRLASYFSYMAGTVWHGLRLRKPSSIVTLTTPPLLSIIGSVLSSLHRTKHIIWEMDLYPDIASDLGFIRKHGLTDVISGMALDWARRRSTAIIVLGEEMKGRLIARGIAETKIHVAENWADGDEITPQPFPTGPLVIHYSGNLGLAHEVETISGIISRLRNHRDFRFVFVGGGPHRKSLEQFCRNQAIENVTFRSFCSRSELGESLAEGHLGLVTQLPQTLGSLVPSKIYGIMAAGRPLLYIGPDKSTPARHIEQYSCGWRVDPGDVDGLEKLLIYLAGNRQLLAESGSRGRAAFEQNFTRAIGVSRVQRVLEA